MTINLPPKRNKYKVRIGPGAAASMTYEGRRYSSRAEMVYFRDNLKLRELGGQISNVQHQPRFELGCPENVYVADFEFVEFGKRIVVDVKGVETPKFRRDRKLWAKYGPCNLRIVKDGRVKETIVPGQPLPRKPRKVRF